MLLVCFILPSFAKNKNIEEVLGTLTTYRPATALIPILLTISQSQQWFFWKKGGREQRRNSLEPTLHQNSPPINNPPLWLAANGLAGQAGVVHCNLSQKHHD